MHGIAKRGSLPAIKFTQPVLDFLPLDPMARGPLASWSAARGNWQKTGLGAPAVGSTPAPGSRGGAAGSHSLAHDVGDFFSVTRH